MLICAIDPGTRESAYIILDSIDTGIKEMGILENNDILKILQTISFDVLAIEMIASYGMSVGKEVFNTCVWVGRFVQAWPGNAQLVYRKDIKIHFCETNRANDANIRTALIDRFGEPGKKANPGKLYGIKKDIWSALAVAVYYADIMPK